MSGGMGLSPRQRIAQQFVDRLYPYCLGYERRLHRGSWKRKRFYEAQFVTMDYAGRIEVLGERYFRLLAYHQRRIDTAVEAFTRDLPTALLGARLLCGLEPLERAKELRPQCTPLADFLLA
jgi:hypothetical protein